MNPNTHKVSPKAAHKSTERLATAYVFAVWLVLALVITALVMYIAWTQNPQGAFHDQSGVQWANWLSIGSIPFVMLGGLITGGYLIGRPLFLAWRRVYPTQLQRWVKQLRYFRFVHALGGRAEDADELKVVFQYRSVEELKQICLSLGIEWIEHTRKPSSPAPGVGYPGDEYARLFPPLIAGTTWIEQLGGCQIAEQSVFVWCKDGQMCLSIGGRDGVSDADVVSATLVERVLDTITLSRVEPPIDDPRCICPKYHPEYFHETQVKTSD